MSSSDSDVSAKRQRSQQHSNRPIRRTSRLRGRHGRRISTGTSGYRTRACDAPKTRMSHTFIQARANAAGAWAAPAARTSGPLRAGAELTPSAAKTRTSCWVSKSQTVGKLGKEKCHHCDALLFEGEAAKIKGDRGQKRGRHCC